MKLMSVEASRADNEDEMAASGAKDPSFKEAFLCQHLSWQFPTIKDQKLETKTDIAFEGGTNQENNREY